MTFPIFDNAEIIFVIIKILLACSLFTGVFMLSSLFLHFRKAQSEISLIILILLEVGLTISTAASLWLSSPLIGSASYALNMLASGALLWLSYSFPNERLTRLQWLALAPSIIFATLSFIPHFLFGSYIFSFGGFTQTTGNIGFYIYHTLLLTYFTYAAIVILLRKSHSKETAFSQQLNFLASGIIILSLLNIFTDIILSGFFDINYFNFLNPLFLLIPASIAYVLSKQYYYVDIRYVLYQLISKIALFLLAGLSYLIALLVFSQIATGHNILIYHLSFIATLLISLKISPTIKHEAIALAGGENEKLRQQALDRYIIDLFRQQHTTTEIANSTAQLCGDILNAKNAKLITSSFGNAREIELFKNVLNNYTALAEESTVLMLETSAARTSNFLLSAKKLIEDLRNIHGAALITTLSSERILYGILVLGDRRDGKGYSKEDVELINKFLLPLSSALAEATFRTQIARLSSGDDTEAGKLRQQVLLRNTRTNNQLDTLRGLARDAILIIRRKLAAIGTFGNSAIPAAEESAEKAAREMETIIVHLEEDIRKPLTEHIDIAPMLHTIVEIFGTKALIKEGHFSYAIPDSIQTICDPQQIYEGLYILLDFAFGDNSGKRPSVLFQVTIEENMVHFLISMKLLSLNKATATDENEGSWSESVFRSIDDKAHALFQNNGGIMREERDENGSINIFIMLPLDAGEDIGGLNENIR